MTESKELEDKDFEDKELEAKFERYITKREACKRFEELKDKQPLIECSFIRNESVERYMKDNIAQGRLREILNLKIISVDIDNDDMKSEFIKLFDTHSFVKIIRSPFLNVDPMLSPNKDKKKIEVDGIWLHK